jgi:outer membrane protein assembly factor BamB
MTVGLRNRLLFAAAVTVSVVSAQATDWPQLLGPNRDGSYPGGDLASTWPADGPRVLWQRTVGQGFSGPAVVGNKVLVFHRLGDKETVDCLDKAHGAPLWHFAYATAYRDDFGFDEGPRATPTVAAGKVYTLGAEGALYCLDLQTGRKVWGLPVDTSLHPPKGFFGVATSPLVVGDKVLVNLGAGAGSGIVAFQADTGDLVWKATDDEASYSSPISARINGEVQALFFTRAGLVVLAPDTGKVHGTLAWRSRSHASVNAATPLVVDDLIFLSASYETGAVLLKASGAKFDRVWASDDVLSNHYATSVFHDGFLYGYHGRQEFGPSLRCVELRTGKVRWSQDHFGAGTILVAGDKLVVLRENGELQLLAASEKAYHALTQAQVLGSGVRAYPAVADGCLLARDKTKLICLDLRQR